MLRSILKFVGMVVGVVVGYIISVMMLGHLYKVYARRLQGRISNEDEEWDFGERLFGIGALGLAIFIIIAAFVGNNLEDPTLLTTFFSYVANIALAVTFFPVIFLVLFGFILFVIFPEG
jgi:hypothetical protein